MTEKEFTACKMYCKAWLPQRMPPRAVLQIVHGLGEMSEYYEQAARYFTDRGIAVYICELRLHGRTAEYCETNSDYAGDTDDICNAMAEDCIAFTDYITQQHDIVPVLLGHSMGAAIAQLMIAKKKYDRVILSGCASFPEIDRLLELIEKETAEKGKSAPSTDAFLAMFGKVAERFPEKCTVSWVTSDIERAEYYEKLPYTNKMYSCGFYHSFLSAEKKILSKGYIESLPYRPKVYIIGGSEDSVGEYGEYPPKLCKEYRKAGFPVQLKIYHGLRHSIMQEVRRENVYQDITEFILTK